jgi:hypothetical protein
MMQFIITCYPKYHPSPVITSCDGGVNVVTVVGKELQPSLVDSIADIPKFLVALADAL